jgi:hypothetical protein
MTSKNRLQILRRVLALRAAGVPFRTIEERLTKSLGLEQPGNGTKALRVYRTAVSTLKAA